MPRNYQYSALRGPRSIRLLNLLPARNGQPIDCELFEVSLDKAPEYESLSYSWGGQQRDVRIWCEGKILYATENCHAALQRLRHKRKPRLLWIDALCMDQDYMNERNRQVAMMGNIYRTAGQVIVWLGEENQLAEKGLQYLSDMTRRSGTRMLDAAMFNGHFHGKNLQGFKIGDPRMFPYIKALFDTEWFARVWPIQEVTLAERCTVMYGDTSLEWDRFLYILPHLKNESLPIDPQARLQTHRKLWKTVQRFNQRPCRLTRCLPTLLYAQHQRATDPRDKIYALHGVLNLLGVPLPNPDYTKRIDTVYCEAAATVIVHDGTIDILTAVTGRTSVPDLPSWVPDWANEQPVSSFSGFWERSRAARDSVLSYGLLDRERSLLSTGFLIDTITECSPAFPNFYELNEPRAYGHPGAPATLYTTFGFLRAIIILRYVYNLWEDDIEQLLSQLVDPDNLDAFRSWSRIIEESRGMEELPEWRTLKQYWTGNVNQRVALIDNHPTLRRLLDTEEFSIYLRSNKTAAREEVHLSIEKLLDRKVVFETAGRRVGIGSSALQVGDRVVLLAGCNVPIVIRPFGTRWRVVCPAIVNGIMQGEAWPVDNRNLHEFIFV